MKESEIVESLTDLLRIESCVRFERDLGLPLILEKNDDPSSPAFYLLPYVFAAFRLSKIA